MISAFTEVIFTDTILTNVACQRSVEILAVQDFSKK